MRFLFATLVAAFVSPALGQTPSQSQSKTGIQLRTEAVSTRTEKADKATQNHSFIVKTARVLVTGDLSDTVSYVLRLDVKNALYSSESQGPDTSIAALDRAFIDHHFIPGLSLKFGRMPVTALSIENDYSSMDRYYDSYILNVVAYQIFPIMSGINAQYSVHGQTFELAAFNGVREVNDKHAGQQKGEDLTWALAYRGNLLGGAIKPIVSYNRASRIRAGDGATRDDKAVITIYGAGAQFSALHADLDLEYDTYNKPAFSSYTWAPVSTVSGTTISTADVAKKNDNKEQKISSYVTQLAYNLPEFRLRPFVKYSDDKETRDGDETLKAKRGALGVEFRPIAAKGFRYHTVVVDQHDDAKASDGKSTRTSIRQYIFGLAAKI